MISTIPQAGQLQALREEAQRQLLSIKRGNAFSLLHNGQDDDEVAGAITGEERDAFPNVLAFLEHEMAPCRLNDTGPGSTPVFDAVGAYVALTSLGAPSEQRAEFIAVAVGLFAHYPEQLVLEACTTACKTHLRTDKFVPFVVERVEETANKLKNDHAIVQRLAALVDSQA